MREAVHHLLITGVVLLVASMPSCVSRGTEGGGAAAGGAAGEQPVNAVAEQEPAYHVDQDRCIGCGNCAVAAPDAYEIDEQTGKARVKAGASEEDLKRGAEACPQGAIVTPDEAEE